MDAINEFLVLLKKIPCLPFCCYCKQGVCLNGRWIYLNKEEGEQVNIFPHVSHSVCPDCYIKKVKPEIEELKRYRKMQETQRLEKGGDC